MHCRRNIPAQIPVFLILLFSLPAIFSQLQRHPALRPAIIAALPLCHAGIDSIMIHTSPVHGQRVDRYRIILLRFLLRNMFYAPVQIISWMVISHALTHDFGFALSQLAHLLLLIQHILLQPLLPQTPFARWAQKDTLLRFLFPFEEWVLV